MTRSTSSPDAFKRICPSREVMARLGEKWTMLVIVALENGPMRFGELRRKVEGVSQKMLSKTARNLERDGLLTRRLIDEKPLHVEYELTERGRELLVVVQALKKWAEKHLHAIIANARSFDENSRHDDATLRMGTL
jgi:DNA-binding HxlR family transcriptional regulator